MACGLALLASGQVFAAGTCTTTAATAWATASTWADGTGVGAACNGTTIIPAAGDNAIIDHDVTVGAAASITNLTVNASKTLTLSANLTVSGTATIGGAVTYTAGTLSLPTTLTTIGGLFTVNSAAGSDFTMPTHVTALNGGVAVTGSSALHLTTANVVGGDVTITNSGALPTLKLSNASHTITINPAKNITTLDTSAFTGTSNTITTSGAFLLTVTTLTPPSTAAAAVKILVDTAVGSALTVTNAPTGATCTSDVAVTGTQAAVTTFPVTALGAGKTLVCTKNSTTTVNAPIDLNMNKPVESYSTDIELK
jgi:hypothetical protein